MHEMCIRNWVIGFSFMPSRCLGVQYWLDFKSPALVKLQLLQWNGKSPNPLLQYQEPMDAPILVFHFGTQHSETMPLRQVSILSSLYQAWLTSQSNTGAHRRDYFWMKLNRRQAPEAQPRQPLPGIQDLGPDELVWNKPPDIYPAQMLGSLALMILLGTCYLLTLPPEPEIYPSKEVFYLTYMPTIF